MKEENTCRSCDYVLIASDPVTCQKTVRPCGAPNCGKKHNRLLHSEPQKQEDATYVSDSTTALATIVTHASLPVLRIKLTSGDTSLNVMVLCNSGSSISFVDQSVVSTLQLQGREASLSVAGIHGSEDVKTEIVPITVSAADKTRPLSTVQFFVHKNLKLGN